MCSCHGPILQKSGFFQLPPKMHKHTPSFFMPQDDSLLFLMIRAICRKLPRLWCYWSTDLWWDLWGKALLLPHPFFFLPLLQRQAKNIRVHLLGCNKQITSQRLFHDLENTSAGDKSFCDVMYDIDTVKTLRSFLFSLPKVWEWTKENQNIF